MVDLPFCGPNIIDHFLCDLNPLLNLACTGTHTLGLFVATNSGLICLLNFVAWTISYVMILRSLKTHSKEVNTPKLIIDYLSGKKIIYFKGCMTQVFGEHIFSEAEIILLMVMAYDRYVAICKPSHYTAIMSRHLFQNLFLAHLPFCGPNVIDHFMCDLYPLLKLVCSDSHTLSVLVAANSSGMCMLIFMLLMIFYAFILHSLKTHSASNLEMWTTIVLVEGLLN
ncbi:olfactory receptor 4C12-like [Tachyglossus aculeatus]|uniref:olfactory receptor 4C12-like n=1 Tax=Tachyglossus aculeatus TaxID=9261 RepID=UPI0018F6E48A|nr:olfactory receptor 4C12-like [Tachyglossus aculeatus]